MEDFIEKEIVIEDFLSLTVSVKEYEPAIKEVSLVNGYRDFLKSSMAADIKRYFTAQPEQQQMIKGAFLRTKYLYDQLVKIGNKE